MSTETKAQHTPGPWTALVDKELRGAMQAVAANGRLPLSLHVAHCLEMIGRASEYRRAWHSPRMGVRVRLAADLAAAPHQLSALNGLHHDEHHYAKARGRS